MSSPSQFLGGDEPTLLKTLDGGSAQSTRALNQWIGRRLDLSLCLFMGQTRSRHRAQQRVLPFFEGTNQMNIHLTRPSVGQLQRTVTFALLFTSVLSIRPSNARELLSDGDFDSLLVGTAPDKRQPAGAWQFPRELESFWEGDVSERVPELFSIVETSSVDSNRPGNSLLVDSRSGSNGSLPSFLMNVFDSPIPETKDGFLRLNFQIFVPELGGRTGGGTVVIGGDHGFDGVSTQTDRGAMLVWERNGDLSAYVCQPGTGCNGSLNRRVRLVDDYPRDQWQDVRIDYNLANDDYDVYWAVDGEDLQLIASDLGIRSQNQRHADNINIAHFPSSGNSVAYFDNFSLEFVSTLPSVALDGAGGVYQQRFDEALGVDGSQRNQPLPLGWSGNRISDFGYETTTTKSFPPSLLARGTLLYNAGHDQDADRALALGIGSNTDAGTLQFLADVTGADASALQLAFDLEAWDADTRMTGFGEAAFDVTIEIDQGNGFEPLLDLGNITTGELQKPDGDYLDGNIAANRVSFDSGILPASIPAGSQLRFRWSVPLDGNSDGWVFGLDNVSVSLFEDLASVLGDFNADGILGIDDINMLANAIQSGSSDSQFDLNQNGQVEAEDYGHWVTDIKQTWLGDATLDGQFDSGDLVEVFTAGQYEDGIAGNSTWATGDWNGDGEFDTGDLVAAFQDGGFEAGQRTAVAAVPEPSALILFTWSLFGVCRFRNCRLGSV
jgi:hypothetical protein